MGDENIKETKNT